MNELLPPELLRMLLLAAALATLAMLVTLLVQRTTRRGRERRRAELDAVHRRLVLESTIAEDDELPRLLARVRALSGAERAHISRTVFMMLQDVTGEAADRLRQVAAASGLAPIAMAAARRRSAVSRADGAEALGRLAPEGALELLLGLSEDRDPEVRTVAVRALGGFEEPAAVARVVQALASGSGVPSTVAATALLQQGQAASDHVRLALRDPDAGIRRGAARVAGLLQVPGAGRRARRAAPGRPRVGAARRDALARAPAGARGDRAARRDRDRGWHDR
ncbi:HEAT repeat domain-containing protein [Agrococcus sp. Marseille-Q4369]|uniref:HEAT repeat domain-containing protein n=1 Tax=Agrococcus sp. Marseille-Q4369 TaxID=2810513 RepID=UPI001B8B428C|nr:HEAT repeat domain-containing protein [Agrococcus sp. Marseille-Q4369]QUW18468.1 HEAT repeat domain-containing protein [Agrococcus sp. Marseille-Q4369]